MIEELVQDASTRTGLSLDQARLGLSAALALMEKHGLRFGDYGSARYTTTLGWSALIEAGVLIARDATGEEVARGWDAVIALLREAPVDQWVDLHLVKTWPADDAIAAAQPFAQRELLPVLLDLAPLYLEMLDPRT